MTLESLEQEKRDLIEQVRSLINKQDQMFGNVDISFPISAEEKQMKRDIADLWSRINIIVRTLRTLRRNQM